MTPPDLTNSEKALNYITACCPRLGASRWKAGGSPLPFLHRLADDIDKAKRSPLFPDRYKEHVAHALRMVAHNSFTDPPAAVASVYLATRFEFWFRLLSGKLNGDGTWVGPAEKKATLSQLNVDKRTRDRLNSQRQLSQVSLTYKVMMLDHSKAAAREFAMLDVALFGGGGYTGTGNFKVQNVGDRIAFGRHNSAHGEWGDMSAEAVFYGLATAIIFYNQ